MRTAAFSSLVFVLFTGSATVHAGKASASKAPDVKPGEWETVMKMEMPGMPMAMPPMTSSKCLTKKDLTPSTAQPGQNCKVSKQKFKGHDLSWAVECTTEDGGTVTMTGKGTYKAETFTGTIQMDVTSGGRTMKMTAEVTSKRIGPCKKKAE